MCMIAGNEKNQKKFANKKKGCNFVAVIKNNNIKQQSNEIRSLHTQQRRI